MCGKYDNDVFFSCICVLVYAVTLLLSNKYQTNK